MNPHPAPPPSTTNAALALVTAVNNRPQALNRLGAGTWWRRQGFLGYIFGKQPIDALAFALPDTDGDVPSAARQVYHRLLARLAAVRMFYRQWLCIIVGGALCVPTAWHPETGVLLYPDLAALVFSLALLAFVILLPSVFMAGVCGEDIRREVEGVVRRCFLREVPIDAPEDLCDPWRHGWLTAEARPISSEITEEDASHRLPRTRAWWWLPAVLCLAVGITTLLFGGVGGYAVLAVAGAKLLFDRDPGALRAWELEAAETVEAHAFAEAGGTPWARGCEAARERQFAEGARQGEDPIVRFGFATGILSARGDLFAPSTGVLVGLSRSDLRTHLLVLGGTGAGKTSGVLRPIARQVGAWQKTGMVVLDGKGGLPRELATSLGFRIIEPGSHRLSLVKGIDPVSLADTLADVVEPHGGAPRGDSFWRDSANVLLRQSAVLAQAAGGQWWTLAVAAQLGANAPLRERVLNTVSDEQIRHSAAVAAAVEYFQYSWPAFDERTRGSITATLQTWFDVIAAHEDLLAWARTPPDADDVSLEDVLRGDRLGLHVPAFRYGRAGAVVAALLKARLYRALKARAEGWADDDTPVVFLIDEAQELTTRDDAAMLSIGRSLGLSVVAAAQTKEALVERLGPATAAKWLGVYGSIIALQGRSPETDAFVAEKLGVTWCPRVAQVEGMAVRSALQVQAVSGVLAARRNQPSLARFITPEHRLHRPTRGVVSGIKRVLLGGATGARPSSQMGPAAIVSPGELTSLLAEPDTALVIFNRARVPRRDVIRLQPEHASQCS